jgi:uncharacterized NAD(P)/FAD-binding protein YdhS
MLDGLEQELGDRSNIKLTLYDAAAEPWRGRAFQADSGSILANMSAAGMSIRHGDSSHAERWLVRHGLLERGTAQDAYLPRQVYGDYIAQHAGELVNHLRRRGWQVDLVQQNVTSIEPAGSSGYILGTEDRRDEFDHVILCAGGSVLDSPFDLNGCDGYIADPYPMRERLNTIPSDATVGVLGSGLTAVDAAVALKERSHSGPIRMYSRSGVLPLTRRSGVAWTAKHLTSEQVTKLARSSNPHFMADVERLFNREAHAWGGKPRGLFPHPDVSGTREGLRRQLEQPHDGSDLETYIFQKSILVWQDIWHCLNADEQRRILASPSTMRSIMSRCCPMPPPNAKKILAMLDSGQLEVRGGLRTVQPGRDAFDVQLATTREQADYIVNAVTPPIYGVHPQVEPLVNSAIRHGLARRHHAGGLEVLASTSAVVGEHRSGGLYALGDLTRGAFFFTFGTPALVHRSIDIARAIRDDIREKVLHHRPAAPATV